MSSRSSWIHLKLFMCALLRVCVRVCVCTCVCRYWCWHWMKEMYFRLSLIWFYFTAWHLTNNPIPHPHVPFKLSHIFHSITWSILLLSFHWKYFLCLEYPNNYHLHLPKFYPNCNSRSYGPSSNGLWYPPPPLICTLLFPLLHTTVFDMAHIAL